MDGPGPGFIAELSDKRPTNLANCRSRCSASASGVQLWSYSRRNDPTNSSCFSVFCHSSGASNEKYLQFLWDEVKDKMSEKISKSLTCSRLPAGRGDIPVQDAFACCRARNEDLHHERHLPVLFLRPMLSTNTIWATLPNADVPFDLLFVSDDRKLALSPTRYNHINLAWRTTHRAVVIWEARPTKSSGA